MRSKWAAARQQEQQPIEAHQQAGRCLCGNGSFKLRIENKALLRVCPKCGELYNVDKNEIVERGKC